MFSAAVRQVIKEACQSANKLGLINFMHDITFGQREISMLVADEKLQEFYVQNKIPTLCTDEQGRTLADGVYLNKTLETMYPECSVLMPLLPRIGQQVGQSYGQNSLHVVVREHDCQHLYSLFFDLNETEFLHWVVNNGIFLQDFINHYNQQAKDVILEAKAKENRVVLPTFKDFALSVNYRFTDSAKKMNRLSLFHKEMNFPIHLSEQQSICLMLLMNGKAVKEIAREMSLSPRTVEHYLEKVRKQLGCVTNRELITSYYNQVM